MSIYPSCDGPRILRVRGYMEMRSTCNLVDMQMMCGIYIYINRHPDAHCNIYVDHSLAIMTYAAPGLRYGAYCKVIHIPRIDITDKPFYQIRSLLHDKIQSIAFEYEGKSILLEYSGHVINELANCWKSGYPGTNGKSYHI